MRTYITCFILMIGLAMSCHAGIRNRIEIDTTRNVLRMYHGYRCIGRYDVATGMKEVVVVNGKKYNFSTPKGHFTVWQKKEHPLWTPPAWNYTDGVIPEVKDRVPLPNRLGSRALYLSYDGIMIHGLNKDNLNSIGLNASHGCIRMRNKDLLEVYRRCPVGTQVYIY